MRIELKDGPESDAMNMKDAKTQGKFKGSSQNERIADCIAPATNYSEQFTGRRLINQSWYIYFTKDEYRSLIGNYFYRSHSKEILLSSLNVSAITEVTQYDDENNASVISNTNYFLSGNQFSEECFLVFNEDNDVVYNELRQTDCIRIEVVAGYGPKQSDIPETIQMAMKQLIDYWVKYTNRSNEGQMRDVPIGFHAMLSPFRYSVARL